LRRQLYRNHLGLIEPQHCPSEKPENVTAGMRMVGIPPNDVTNTPEDQLVAVRVLARGRIGSQIDSHRIHCRQS
jgi:hypothetical protein